MSVDVTAEEEAPDFADLDLTDPDHFSEGIPHHIFKRLRRHAPVLWTQAPSDWPESVGRGQWNVTRAEHIRTVSRDWQTFSAARGGIMMDNRQAGGLDLLRATLLGKDPPEHTRQRRIVDKALTPNRVARLEDGVRATVERYLRAFKTSGPADVVAGFTSKVPLNVVCDLLGVPEQDRAQVFAWSQAVIADHDPEMIRNYGRPGETRRQALEYVGGLLHERAKCPADDLATFFANATIDGEPVPHEHREGFFMQLFEAGADTTMNAMSFGIQAFSDFPDQWEVLLEDRGLVPNAVEEILRWASVSAYSRRTATRDTELEGQEIREGDAVVMWFASGNYDESAFDHADTFDVTREKNSHFGFGGGGRHFCVGASLARLELRVMLEALLEHLHDLRVAGPIRRTRGNKIRGVKELPVTFSARAGASY